MAGLACALRLQQAQTPFRLYEAAEAVGGRVRTDLVDGFRLDRGFQVLLTAYPEAQRILNYENLKLQKFEPGALVRFQGKFHRFVDPWRRPRHALATALSPLATFGDKLRVGRLRSRLLGCSMNEIYETPETTTRDALKQCGFSETIIQRFFRPFLGGIFLEDELTTSSRKFEFVFRMFSQGEAALPAKGMEEIARQLADQLPSESIYLNAPVQNVRGNTVELTNGETDSAEWVVIACDAPQAATLLGEKPPPGHSVSCLYFAAKEPPVREPILVLNGDQEGPINNLCVPSQVSSAYAPRGQSLISVSVLQDSFSNEQLLQHVTSQLRDWFGAAVEEWRHLRTYRISHALPAQSPPALDPVAKPIRRGERLLVCGDYLDFASLQGALTTGRRSADEIIAERGT